MSSHYGVLGKSSLLVALVYAAGGAGFHMRGTESRGLGSQRVLGTDYLWGLSMDQDSLAYGFKGYGDALSLVHGSPSEWMLSARPRMK